MPVIDESEIDYSDPDADQAAVERIPLIVRALEWLNAPLAGLSRGVREALGKVAIVTSLNAIAVLAYVLLFRKH